jgi:hypothetical protein
MLLCLILFWYCDSPTLKYSQSSLTNTRETATGNQNYILEKNDTRFDQSA